MVQLIVFVLNENSLFEEEEEEKNHPQNQMQFSSIKIFTK